jgi:hypothetical protein
MPNPRKGSASPTTTLDDATVRRMRLAHLMEGESASALARIFGVSIPCASRICRWLSWAHTDPDLKLLPRPIHRGGGSRPGTAAHGRDREQRMFTVGPTCRECIHLDDRGCCGLGFPECLNTNYKEAAKCNAFASINTIAGATSDV